MPKKKSAPQSLQKDMIWLCGLYRFEEGLPVFVIFTRETGEKIRFIHDRMPLIIPEDRVEKWIDPKENPSEVLPYAFTDMDFDKEVHYRLLKVDHHKHAGERAPDRYRDEEDLARTD